MICFKILFVYLFRISPGESLAFLVSSPDLAYTEAPQVGYLTITHFDVR